MGLIRGHQTSHDSWVRQNFSPPRAPITHATPLQRKWTSCYAIR